MTTHMSLHSLMFFLGILIFAAADDLVLPALTLETGPNDFLPQQPQTNNTVPADVSRNDYSQTHDFKVKEELDNVDEENDSSKTDTLGERGGLLALPVAIVSSNLTSQPVVSVATSTSESPQEQEDTEPSNKGQDEWSKEATNDEGYYDEDGKGGEEVKNNNWEGDKAHSDDGYVNQESTYSDEEELDEPKKTQADDDESGTLWDVDNGEDDDRDDFNSDKIHLVEDVVDEDMASRSRLPTAPTSMVVFYTWMIVAILIFVVGISMYQSHCHGFRFRLPGSKASSSGSDRKRLLDHEFV